jgi:hypothetical protein
MTKIELQIFEAFRYLKSDEEKAKVAAKIAQEMVGRVLTKGPLNVHFIYDSSSTSINFVQQTINVQFKEWQKNFPNAEITSVSGFVSAQGREAILVTYQEPARQDIAQQGQLLKSK